MSSLSCSRESEPRRLDGASHHRIALGSLHDCVVTPTGLVGCAGYNREGQLGDGTTEDRRALRVVSELHDIESVAAGGAFTCALQRSGQVWCWGENVSGQVSGESLTPATPQLVHGLRDIVEIAAGGDHACARDRDGAVWCWGCGLNGQLGNGDRRAPSRSVGEQSTHEWVDTLSARMPVRVSGMPAATKLAAGSAGTCNAHTCAIDAAGRVWCWGEDRGGAIGSRPTAESNAVPGIVTGAPKARAIAAGAGHTCAVSSEGRVACWGNNADGQLGDGTRLSRTSPVYVNGLEKIEAIAAGGNHTCAVDHAGSVFCFGSNEYGQLGTGDREAELNPTRIAGLPPIQEIAAGCCSTCARTTEGNVWCWGRNDEGRYSRLASTDPTLQPTRIDWPTTNGR
jgi:alpha-tubulin suppressor-like RCC1 family protein